MRRIGVLMGFAETDPTARSWVKAFRDALARLGWAEGSNLRLELRWAAADPDRIRTLTKELVELRPDAIFDQTTPVTGALARETQTIPIVAMINSEFRIIEHVRREEPATGIARLRGDYALYLVLRVNRSCTIDDPRWRSPEASHGVDTGFEIGPAAPELRLPSRTHAPRSPASQPVATVRLLRSRHPLRYALQPLGS